MDVTRKLELLQQQIDEGNNGRPADFELWRQNTDVVLRNVLGDANPLYESFTNIRYTLVAFTMTTPESRFEEAKAAGVSQAIAILKAAKLEVEVAGVVPKPASDVRSSGQRVFIVHGHDHGRTHEVARFLTAVTHNEPVILHEQANEGRAIIEKFESHAADAAYAVVIATADDVGRAKDADTERPRPRQNVILELGFFFGSLGRARVALLYEEGVERPSDIDGVLYVPLDAAGAWKPALARELKAAGVGVDPSGLIS